MNSRRFRRNHLAAAEFLLMQLSRRTRTFVFDSREFVVQRGVFDPVRHLSGIAFAEYLRAQDFAGRRVLDLGTGSGVLAAAVSASSGLVTATDVDPRSAGCARRNLEGTGVDVRCGDLFDPVRGERFDVIVVNPPYEVGRGLRVTTRSPDLLARLGRDWRGVADALMLAFPTDSVDVLAASGIPVTLVHRIPTAGRELGIFGASDGTARSG